MVNHFACLRVSCFPYKNALSGIRVLSVFHPWLLVPFWILDSKFWILSRSYFLKNGVCSSALNMNCTATDASNNPNNRVINFSASEFSIFVPRTPSQKTQ